MNDLWNQIAASAGVTLEQNQHANLARYLDLLLKANQTMNLTRIVDRASAEVQHVGDALTALPHLPREAHRLVDVGTGGGVPGIPLAIARPDIKVVLIEATHKKAAFLERAVDDLRLHNVQVICQRAEDAGRGEMRETFDVAIARAVGTMVWLAEWCLPLVKIGGKMLAMKGPKAAQELPVAQKAFRMLGAGPPVTHPVDLPGATGLVIVEIPKLCKSDPKLPRLATIAKGNPL